MEQEPVLIILYWHWLLLGGALVAMELVVPGKLFLWVGIAAFATGFGAVIFPEMSPFLQLVLFASVTVSSILGGRLAVKNRTDDQGSD